MPAKSLFKKIQSLCRRKFWVRYSISVFALAGGITIGEISKAAKQIDEDPIYSNNHGSSRTDLNPKEKGFYGITLKRRALLNTIRFAEGTWKEGEAVGYRTLYGGETFNDMSRHPNRTVIKKYSSAAAGAYQIIPSTWISVSNELRLPNFKPLHQDQAALHLVSKRGALLEVDTRGLTSLAISRLAKEWASFPNMFGESEYNQPVKSHEELLKFYTKNLQDLKNGISSANPNERV